MYSKKQRFIALLGIIFLVLLYVITLIFAIFDFDGSGKLFHASLYASLIIPLMIWIITWISGKFRDDTSSEYENNNS